jgi:hypothetical protein
MALQKNPEDAEFSGPKLLSWLGQMVYRAGTKNHGRVEDGPFALQVRQWF